MKSVAIQSIKQKETSANNWWNATTPPLSLVGSNPSLLSNYANTPSGTYTLFTTMVSNSSTMTLELIKYCQQAEVRPSNIGTGIWAKTVAKEVSGTSKAIQISSKISTGLAVAGVALDVGIGIAQNVENKSSPSKYITDAAVDIAVSGGTAVAAGLAASTVSSIAAGAAIGSVVPGLGTAVGAVIGIGVAIGSYILFDTKHEDGTTTRDQLKESANNYLHQANSALLYLDG